MSEEQKWTEDANGVWHWGGVFTLGRSEESMPRWYATGPGMFAWSRGGAHGALHELRDAYKDSTRTLSGAANEGRAEQVETATRAWTERSIERFKEIAATIQFSGYIERSEFAEVCEAAGMKATDEDREDFRRGEWFASWNEGEVMVGVVGDVGDPDTAGDFPATTEHADTASFQARLAEVFLMAVDPKLDTNKPDIAPLLTIPIEVLAECARVRAFGVAKYGADNWRNVARSRWMAAALRHLAAEVQEPGSRDAETGERHLAHVVVSVLLGMGVEV
jgi:hypothetical protein